MKGFCVLTENLKITGPPKTIFLFSLAGILFLWIVTSPWGLGLSPDSGGYLSAARGLLEGRGLVEPSRWNQTIPLLNFPPLFPTLLAGIGWFRLDPLEGAKILHLFLFGINIAGAGWFTFYATRSGGASLWASFFMLVSWVILEIHAMVWSEPAFIFFGFLGLFLLSLYLDEKGKDVFLWASAASFGLAFLTKYSGISFVATGILAILFLGEDLLLKKIKNCLVLGAVSSLGMAGWLLRNHLKAGRSTELSLYFEPYVWNDFRQTVSCISMWLLPENFPPWVRGTVLTVALLLLGLATAVFIRKKKKEEKRSTVFPWVLLLFSACFVGTYFLTTTFMGEQPLDNRGLSPVFIAGLIYVLVIGNHLRRILAPKSCLRISLTSLTLLLAVSYLVRGGAWALHAEREGLGYAGKQWKTSETVQALKRLPSDVPIYTNAVDVAYLLARRLSSPIPAKEDLLKVHIPDLHKRQMKDYKVELEKMRQELKRGRGFVIFFNRIYWRWYYPSEEELVRTIPLQRVQKFSDGALYQGGQ